MSDDIKVDKVFDLKGLPCPMPVVKVSKGIKDVEIGQVIEAQSTDPGSLTDFPAWARTSAFHNKSRVGFERDRGHNHVRTVLAKPRA